MSLESVLYMPTTIGRWFMARMWWCSMVGIYINSDMGISPSHQFIICSISQWIHHTAATCFIFTMSPHCWHVNKQHRRKSRAKNGCTSTQLTQLTSKMQYIPFNNMKNAILSSAESTVKANMFWLLCYEILHTYVILDEARTRL